jgi:hypothetical protein
LIASNQPNPNRAPIEAPFSLESRSMSIMNLPSRKQRAQEADFASLEFVRNDWRYTAPHGVPLEIVKAPDYWAHLARKVRRGDTIEVLAEDGAYDCTYRVVSIMGLLVHLRPLREWIADGSAPAATAGTDVQIVTDRARVKFIPRGDHKWRVENAAGEVVSKGHETRESAEAAMAQYLASLGPMAA